jgi:hydroxypyruvate reductase
VRHADAGSLLTRALERSWPVVDDASHVLLLALGKAAPVMAQAWLQARHTPVRAGLVVGTHAGGPLPPHIRWHPAGHPVPDHRSEAAARGALDLVASANEATPIILLLSGGASALAAAPGRGITLEQKQAVTRTLLAADASIQDLNTVRKHLSAVKGGWLAAHARGPVITFAVSDVVGDDPAVIGSGPTSPDPTTFADACAVIERTVTMDALPTAARDRLLGGARGEHHDTPKPGDPRLAQSDVHVIGSNADAVAGACQAAAARGYRTVVIKEPVVGEARDAGRRHADLVARLGRETNDPLCIVSGGETTVHVVGTGRGGRNQEMALALAIALADLGRPVLAGCVGTDGVDGPTDAAGARVASDTMVRAAERDLRALKYLEANDAYTFFAALGDLIRTGPTRTNVGDLQIVLLGARQRAARESRQTVPRT